MAASIDQRASNPTYGFGAIQHEIRPIQEADLKGAKRREVDAAEYRFEPEAGIAQNHSEADRCVKRHQDAEVLRGSRNDQHIARSMTRH